MWHYFTAIRSELEREAEPETGITAELSQILHSFRSRAFSAGFSLILKVHTPSKKPTPLGF